MIRIERRIGTGRPPRGGRDGGDARGRGVRGDDARARRGGGGVREIYARRVRGRGGGGGVRAGGGLFGKGARGVLRSPAGGGGDADASGGDVDRGGGGGGEEDRGDRFEVEIGRRGGDGVGDRVWNARGRRARVRGDVRGGDGGDGDAFGVVVSVGLPCSTNVVRFGRVEKGELVVDSRTVDPAAPSIWAMTPKSTPEAPTKETQWLYCTDKGSGRAEKMPHFKWTGDLRPAMISHDERTFRGLLTVPKDVVRTDYAETSYPNLRQSLGCSKYCTS